MARLKSDYMMVMSFSILFGLLFWLVDGYFEYLFFHRNLKFLLLEGPETLAESLFIKVPMHSLFVRISFIAAACLGGILLSFFLYRKNLYQKKLHHLNSVLMAVRNVNQLIVKENDPGRLIERACKNLTETMGYRNAWIALLGGEEGSTLGLPSQGAVAAAAAAGFDGDFEAMRGRLERGEFPACMKRALDADNAVVSGDPASDCSDCTLSVDYGGRAALARRLAFNGVTYGVLTASVPASYARDAEEQDLFNEVASDLAFALHKIAADRRLEETRDRFRLVFEAANVGKSITLPTGEVDVNKAFAEMLGYAPEELRGKTWQELTPPEDVPETERRIAPLLDGREDATRFEKRYLRKNGGAVWTDVSVTIRRDSHHRPLHFITTVVDINERKQAEEELRKHRDHLEELVEERTAELRDLNLFSNTILDTSPVGIVTYRADGQCVSANENTGTLIGATREQVLGQNIRTLASWRESDLLTAADRCLETGKPQRALISTWTNFGKDVILDTRFARFMARGEPHLLLTFSDITDRVRAEEGLKRYSAQLEAANRELEAFAYSVSHDLRAPLRSINGFSEALLEDYADTVDEQGKDHLRRVRAGAQRMGELIEDLLKLSRITRWEMKQRKVDISDLARQTVASLRQSQPGRDVDVIIEEGLSADADIRLLRVVMENLLGNAWKFSGKTANARIDMGKARNSELGTRNAELPDDAVVYFVRDNGAGFDMDYADKLFGAFQRLHSTAEFEGSGIGLATVQRAVLRHGGRIWAEGNVGKGATFYFTLYA